MAGRRSRDKGARGELMVTEKEFESQIKDMAKLFGWLYYHTWRSIHSPAGFPDVVMARPPRIIFVELKSFKGKVSGKQSEWLETLGQCPNVEVFLWRAEEESIEEIAEILKWEY